MALFRPTVNNPDDEETTNAHAYSSKANIELLNLTYETKQKQTIAECFDGFQPNKTFKFFSDGAWSMHHLVQYFLEQTGPADLTICTWTLTEEPARILLNLKELGLIKSLTCLFDYRIQDRSPKSFQLIEGLADSIKLTKAHAKVAAIINDDFGVSIVGSANFSRNRRIEAGTIFTSREAALFDHKWINHYVNDTK
jgi:hypothetical protein